MAYRPGPLQRWKEKRRNMDREHVSNHGFTGQKYRLMAVFALVSVMLP